MPDDSVCHCASFAPFGLYKGSYREDAGLNFLEMSSTFDEHQFPLDLCQVANDCERPLLNALSARADHYRPQHRAVRES